MVGDAIEDDCGDCNDCGDGEDCGGNDCGDCGDCGVPWSRGNSVLFVTYYSITNFI